MAHDGIITTPVLPKQMKLHIAMTKDILQSDIDFARWLVEANCRDDEVIAAGCQRGLEVPKRIGSARFPELV